MSPKVVTLLAAGVVAVGVVASMRMPAGAPNGPKPSGNAPHDAAQETTATTPVEDGTYVVSTADSSVNWEGRKTLIVGYKDVGTIGMKEGEVTFVNGLATGGKFTFDMAAITVGATGRQKGESNLEKHLKSGDFFDVEKHPTAEFTIVDSSKGADGRLLVRGDLTMKGKTVRIEFPAETYMKDGAAHAKATLTLERTKWDIRYGSTKFFDDLKDNVIDDNFTVSFHLLAHKR